MEPVPSVDVETRPLAGPLYHYTSLDALLPIYKDGVLRATHMAYLNDSSEIQLGLSVLLELIGERLPKTDNREHELLCWLRDHVSSPAPILPPVFVVCFSEAGNLLSQWRSYTPLGRGVCVGFEHTNLIERAVRGGWHWLSCCYKRESHRAWMNAFLTRFMRQARERPADEPVPDAASAVMEADGHALYECAAHVKHEAFSEEREWRLVSPKITLVDQRVQYRVGRSSLVPYVDYRLTDSKQPHLRLAGVIVGPTPHVEASVAAVTSMLATARPGERTWAGYCGIPFREV